MKARTTLRLYYIGRIILFLVLIAVCLKPALGYLGNFQDYVKEAFNGFNGVE
jgi:hypothetical protein